MSAIQQLLASSIPAAGGGHPSGVTLTHWWRAQDIGGLSDGDPVSTWTDGEGVADLTGSGTTRPLYRAGGGNPYLEFDGSDDTLHATLAAMTDVTWVVVVDIRSANDYERILETGGVNLHVLTVGDLINFETPGLTVNGNLALPARPTGDLVIFAERSGTAGKLRVNGGEFTNTVNATATGTTFRVAEYTSAGYNLECRVKEICVLDGLLSGGDFTSLASYISSEYGLTL